MKAAVCTTYGPPEVLKLQEVEKPVPNKNEICIRNYASAVTAGDICLRGASLPPLIRFTMKIFMGFSKPRKSQSILGNIVAGEVECVGEYVTQYKKGDRVYGISGCRFGAYGEYTCVPTKDSAFVCIAKIPANLSYEESAAVAFGGVIASHYVSLGKVRPGKKVLIYGASGAIGSMAIQIAKYMGAHVTGVCSTSNLEMVKSLGADQVIDYTKQNILSKRLSYDFILDAVGKAKTSDLKMLFKRVVKSEGKYLSVDDGIPEFKTEYLEKINELIEQGHIKPVIDKKYSLEDIVEAHRYVEKGHKKGNVVITL